MKHFRFSASPAIVVLTLWIGLQSGVALASTEFTGRVLGLDSMPIANASVSLAQMTSPSGPVVKAESTMTDSAGKFSMTFDSVVAYDWTWSVNVAKDGYDHSDNTFAPPIGTPPQINLGTTYLSKTRPSSTSRDMIFTILMPDGTTPAAGAIVSAVFKQSDYLSLSEPGTFLIDTADQQGRVVMTLGGSWLSMDFLGLVVDAQGGLSAQKVLKNPGWLGEFDGTAAGDTLRLQPQGFIEGTVRDTAGIPVPDYPVRLERLVTKAGRGSVQDAYGECDSARTDSAGRFVLTPDRTLHFNTQCRIQTPRPDSLAIGCPIPGSRAHKDYTLPIPSLKLNYPGVTRGLVYGSLDAQGYRLTGNLVTRYGGPVVDATVLIANYTPDGTIEFDSTRSDQGGAFVLYTHRLGSIMEYRKTGFLASPVMTSSWLWTVQYLSDRDHNIAGFKLGTTVMFSEPPPDGISRFHVIPKPEAGKSLPKNLSFHVGCLAKDSATGSWLPQFHLPSSFPDSRGEMDMAYPYPFPEEDPSITSKCDRFIVAVDADGCGAVDTLADLAKLSAGDTLALQPNGTFSGRMLDSAGFPAKDRVLHLRTDASGASGTTEVGTATTDSAGNYVLVLSQNTYVPMACHIDYSLTGAIDVPCPLLGQKVHLDVNMATGIIRPGPIGRFRLRRQSRSGGLDRLELELPYDHCALRVLSADGTFLYRGILDHGSRTVTLPGSSRLLLVQWSSPQGRGAIKVPAL